MPVQKLGLVGSPGRPQTDDAHCPPLVHGVPASAPPMHRSPPHTVAPAATQSASDVHGVAAALLHVLHGQRRDVNPNAVQLGFVLLNVTVWTPVVSGTVVASCVIFAPAVGGQSKLTSSAKSALEPLTVHGIELR